MFDPTSVINDAFNILMQYMGIIVSIPLIIIAIQIVSRLVKTMRSIPSQTSVEESKSAPRVRKPCPIAISMLNEERAMYKPLINNGLNMWWKLGFEDTAYEVMAPLWQEEYFDHINIKDPRTNEELIYLSYGTGITSSRKHKIYSEETYSILYEV